MQRRLGRDCARRDGQCSKGWPKLRVGLGASGDQPGKAGCPAGQSRPFPLTLALPQGSGRRPVSGRVKIAASILGLSLPADGTFGLATKSAVERFQQEHNIVPAEGIVGPQTKAALDNPGSNSAGTPPGQLNPGQQITSGTQIASPDGKFVLQMQSDGNLVIRAPGNVPIGDTRTAGHDGTIAVMQADGNFVLRAPGNIPVWASGTDGHPGTVLQVQNEQYVTHCGITTCTKYFTRAATKRINANVQEQQNRIIALGTAGPTVACAIAGAALGAGIGAAVTSTACAVVSADKIASLVDALKQASDANQCFAMKAPKGLDNLSVVGLYASNYLVRSNQYCTDGN